MNFADVIGLLIPEGEVVKIAAGDVTLWEKLSDYRDIYQRVEYITTPGSTDGGYIVTDFTANDQSGMELTAAFDTLVDNVPMGSRIDSGETRFYTPYPLSAYTVYYGFNVGSSKSLRLTANTKYRVQTNIQNSRYARVYNAAGSSLGNWALSGTLAQQTCPVAIGCYLRADGTLGARRPMKMYGAKCSQGSDVVREYIPCYRKSDGVIGMYETYTGQFYPPAGGAFAAGPDIDW